MNNSFGSFNVKEVLDAAAVLHGVIFASFYLFIFISIILSLFVWVKVSYDLGLFLYIVSGLARENPSKAGFSFARSMPRVQR